jgi:TonB family protein
MFTYNFPRVFFTVILLLTICLSMNVHSDDNPTVFFYVAYIFEARTNGEEIAFPILPGEIAISTIDNVLETTDGYIDKLRSIYAYNYFTTLTTLSGVYYLEKEEKMDGGAINGFFREKNQIFSFSVMAKSYKNSDNMLSTRIEMFIKPFEKPGEVFDKNSIPLLKTLCTLKHGQPLVIGRKLTLKDENNQALFIVFTPFFHRLTHENQYEEVIATYNRVMQLTPGSGDLGAWNIFKKINHYFKTTLKRQNILPLDEIIPPTPPPPSDNEEPIFFKYDEAPIPVGGWPEIQRNLVYPAIAQKSGIEGKVVVNAEIDENGVVGKTWILKSLPGGCDEAAVEALRKTKWKPALHRDKPVKVRVAITLEFRLH